MNLDCTILHLEDDDNDSLFFQRALDRLKFTGTYRRVSTVQDAMDYLAGTGVFAERPVYPLPDVLVTDNSLGELTGPQMADLLQWLDARAEFRSLVRIVLTGDMPSRQKDKCLERGVHCVLSKGASHEDIAIAVVEVLRRCGPEASS